MSGSSRVSLLRAVPVAVGCFPRVVAALIGVGATRLGVRQYTTNARAYSLASEELAIIRSRIEVFDCDGPDSDRRWAAEVADAEEAVSREHTMWRASRSQPE
ncbi:SLATT domain-containing protein [Kribbella sp. NPDC023972]|uniref:SLATT domain-containing protein n=1 Tax=Kribbella sp. NPDC023972 TaxID=3154795 RepID=UPI0034110D41